MMIAVSVLAWENDYGDHNIIVTMTMTLMAWPPLPSYGDDNNDDYHDDDDHDSDNQTTSD